MSIDRHPRRRRGFTLAELIIAGVITTFVLGTISMSLSNLAKAKLSSRQRLEAHLRADAALSHLRRDIASMIRTDDLFFTRFLLFDGSTETPLGQMDRDELLVFNNRLRPIRSIEFQGEGTQYETQYRIEDGDIGPSLWGRRDHLPDKYPLGGGTATPVVDSIVGLKVEAYDGLQWWDEWDSDYQGVPYAVRITVTASGDYRYEDVFDAPTATLRTVVSLDRILLPRQNLVDLMALETEDDGLPELPGDDLLNPDGLNPNGPAGIPGDVIFGDDLFAPDGPNNPNAEAIAERIRRSGDPNGSRGERTNRLITVPGTRAGNIASTSPNRPILPPDITGGDNR